MYSVTCQTFTISDLVARKPTLKRIMDVLLFQSLGIGVAHTLSLTSFFHRCNVDFREGVVSTAAACASTASGYKKGPSQRAAVQTFIFTPAKIIDLVNPVNPPTFGKFSSAFRDLSSVNFAFKGSGLLEVDFEMDNLVGYIIKT